ncbi:MAG: type II secretion system secretin GspD [Desulfobacterota bacterium]|nr:type II secretion system secretin GspD [Thermodesulfobacteriota bacterium]
MKRSIALFIALFMSGLFSLSGCAGTKAVHREGQPPVTIVPQKTATDNASVLPHEPKSKPSRAPVAEAVQQPEQTPQGPQIPAHKEQATTTRAALSDNKTGEKIALNFDNADIYEVINALSDFLGINYIIDPAVKGKVNIHTSGEIDRSQLLPVLESIFAMNNIAMAKVGEFYKIVPVKEVSKEIMDIHIGTDIDVPDSYDRIVIQIVPLRYIPSGEAAKVLKPFTGKGGDIIEYQKGNILILVETAVNVKKLLKIISVLDTDAFATTNIRFFKIKNADVNDLAKELENIFTSFGIEKSSAKGIGLSVIPIERAGCIVAVSPIPGVLDKVQHWIEVLDTIDTESDEQIFIYFVENGKASDIADILIQLYGGDTKGAAGTRTAKARDASSRSRTKSTKSRYRSSRQSSLQREQQSDRTKTQEKTQAITSGTIGEHMVIVTDESTNAIIVKATPLEYAKIKDTIRRLDIIPRQVLIEVLIAEVTLSGDTQFGVEWALLGGKASIGGYKGSDKAALDFGLGGLGTFDPSKSLGTGFAYRFDSSRLQAFLLAQASANKLNVLSSPHILAADNKEARIEVGEEVPIVTSEYVPIDRETTTSTSRSIEYRSTGVILTVTPRINDKGLVAMDIYQEVSEAQPVTSGGIQSPVINNRQAETSLVVQHGETIVIGGLIRDRVSKTTTGVPLLSRIPLVSYLFSNTKDTKNKTELVILITPHVVSSIDEATLMTREFKDKMDIVRKLIQKSSDTWMQEYKK